MIGLALVGGTILGLRLRVGLALVMAAGIMALHVGFHLEDGLIIAAVEAWLFVALAEAVALSVAILKEVVLTTCRACA